MSAISNGVPPLNSFAESWSVVDASQINNISNLGPDATFSHAFSTFMVIFTQEPMNVVHEMQDPHGRDCSHNTNKKGYRDVATSDFEDFVTYRQEAPPCSAASLNDALLSSRSHERQ